MAEGHKMAFGHSADVAQLVEQRFRKPQVTGSNPVVGSLHFALLIADCGLFDIR